MRDLLFVVFLPFLLVLTMTRPFIGAALWVWVTLFVPTSWVWGAASAIRFNLLIVIVAFVSYFLHKKVHADKPVWTSPVFFALAFYVQFSLSTYFALTQTSIAFQWWDTFSRVLLLLFFCQLVLTRHLHWNVFIWAMVIAIGGYAVLETTKYVVSGFQHTIVGIQGSQLRDRNDLSMAMVAMMPLAIYLRSQVKHRGLRLALGSVLLCLVIAVLGTYSRGGLITLVALTAYYLVTSGRRFVPVAIVVGLLATFASMIVSEDYVERAGTIQTVAEDESFMGRVAAWKLSVYIALDRPLIGGGPFAVQTFDVWPRYEHVYDPDQWVRTGPYSNATRAAHSIYFQVLGDTGFIGFALYFSMMGTALLQLRRSRRVALQAGRKDLAELCKALMLALACVLLAGAALSIAYLDFVFALLGLSAAVGGQVPRLVAGDRAPATRHRGKRASTSPRMASTRVA